MDLDEYQRKASKFAIYPTEKGLEYTALALNEEAGEVAGKIAKFIRDDGSNMTYAKEQEILKELGDTLWQLAMCAKELGYTLNYVAKKNIAKLQDRQDRNQIEGTGDNR